MLPKSWYSRIHRELDEETEVKDTKGYESQSGRKYTWRVRTRLREDPRVYVCNGGESCTRTMQLMTLNSLLMFDIVFLFFLFLVGVSCLVYYLPATRAHDFAPHEIITARTSPRYDSPIDNV